MKMKITGTTESRRLIRMMGAQLAGLSLALSIAFFLSNPERLSALSYLVIARTGGSTTWGMIFLFCGVAVGASCYADFRTLRLAAILASIAYTAIALTFTLTAIQYSTANLTAPVVYGWIAWSHVFLAILLTSKIHRCEER